VLNSQAENELFRPPLALFHDQWVLAVLFLALLSIGQYSAFAVFWAIPPSYMTPTTVATGIAVVSSFGQISGMLPPWKLGILKASTGDIGAGLYLVAAGITVILEFGREAMTAKPLTSP
jgi:nitrate/nitrite transporter NarK